MDWLDLPLDLLHLISKKLPDLSDFIRFRAVCKKWRSASPLSDPPSQLPWAVVGRWDVSSFINFYSLYSCKKYTIMLDEIAGKKIIGSSHHYMLVFDPKNRCLSLLNPFTKNKICLPRTDSDWHRPLCIRPDFIKDGGETVISWNSNSVLTIGSCRPGIDEEWRTIQIPLGSYGQTYYKGLYYVNERETMITKVIDLSTGITISTVPPPIRSSSNLPCRLDYLINSSGELLGVYGGKWTSRAIKGYKFELYLLNNKQEIPQWVEMNGIGDRILFLDDTIGFCLKASDYPGFEGNCIYFIAYIYSEVDRFYEYPLCKYNIGNGRCEEVMHGGYLDMSSWFFPNMNK